MFLSCHDDWQVLSWAWNEMLTSWLQRRERSSTIWWWPRAATSSKIDAGNSPLYPSASWESEFLLVLLLCNTVLNCKRFYRIPVSSHAFDCLTQCQACLLSFTVFTPSLLNTLLVILFQEALVWMRTCTPSRTHSHIHSLSTCKCFPKLTAKHPIGHRHSQEESLH